MMARSLRAPSIGRIQKRKTNLLQIIIFGLQRAAGPYRRANKRPEQAQQSKNYERAIFRGKLNCLSYFSHVH